MNYLSTFGAFEFSNCDRGPDNHLMQWLYSLASHATSAVSIKKAVAPIYPANLRRKNRFSSFENWTDASKETSKEVSNGEKTLVGWKAPKMQTRLRNMFPLVVIILVSLIGQAGANLSMN